MRALLKVLHVLACRAASPPSIEMFLNLATNNTTDINNNNVLNKRNQCNKLYLSEMMAKRLFPDYNDYIIKTNQNTNMHSSTIIDSNVNVCEEDSINDVIDSLIAFDQNLNILKYDDVSNDNIDKSSSEAVVDIVQDEYDQSHKEEEDKENNQLAATPSIQLLVDIIHRSCYFITLQDIQVQVTIIETINAALLRLSITAPTQYFLPCIHSLWPTIMQRVQEIRIELHKDPNLLLQANINNNRSNNSLLINSTSSTSSVTSSLINMLGVKEKKQNDLHVFDHNSSENSFVIHQNNNQIQVLSYIFDTISILAISAKSFMTIKFKDDFLPELLLLLCIYQNKYLRISTSTLLTLSTTTSPSKSGSTSKIYSIHTKVKLSLLGMLLQLIHIKELASFMQINATVIVWFLIQFLSSNEVTIIAMSVYVLSQFLLCMIISLYLIIYILLQYSLIRFIS